MPEVTVFMGLWRVTTPAPMTTASKSALILKPHPPCTEQAGVEEEEEEEEREIRGRGGYAVLMAKETKMVGLHMRRKEETERRTPEKEENREGNTAGRRRKDEIRF